MSAADGGYETRRLHYRRRTSSTEFAQLFQMVELEIHKTGSPDAPALSTIRLDGDRERTRPTVPCREESQARRLCPLPVEPIAARIVPPYPFAPSPDPRYSPARPTRDRWRQGSA